MEQEGAGSTDRAIRPGNCSGVAKEKGEARLGMLAGLIAFWSGKSSLFHEVSIVSSGLLTADIGLMDASGLPMTISEGCWKHRPSHKAC